MLAAASCKREQIVDLSPTGEYIIELDSISTFESEMVQLITFNNQPMLLVLNEYDNSIYYYHYPKGNLFKKVKYEVNGEQGVGGVSAFLWHNQDSIFLLNSYRTVLLVDETSKILNKISIVDIKDWKDAIPDPSLTSATRPMQIIGQNLYLNGVYFRGNKRIKPINVVNLESDSTYAIYEYPIIEPYTNKLRIEGYYFFYAHCYNSKKGYFVYSFSADDSLRVTNFADINFSVIASTQIIAQIDPYLEEGKVYTDEEYKLVHLTKKYYAAILYDSYKNQYYRFFENGASQKDIETERIKDDFHVKEHGFIVLDGDFNPIKTVLLPKATYNINNVFVSQDGLCILNQKKCMENEDLMYYDIFTL